MTRMHSSWTARVTLWIRSRYDLPWVSSTGLSLSVRGPAPGSGAAPTGRPGRPAPVARSRATAASTASTASTGRRLVLGVDDRGVAGRRVVLVGLVVVGVPVKRSSGSSIRRVSAHIEHPGTPGSSLCGRPPCAVVPCPDCLARWEAMAVVHVQSTRRPDLAFCGVVLQGPGVLAVRLGQGSDPVERPALPKGTQGANGAGRARRARGQIRSASEVLARAREPGVVLAACVTAVQARQMVRGQFRPVPLHQACVLNLGRFLGRLGVGDEILSPGDPDED